MASIMDVSVVALPSPEALSDFVRKKLCAHDHLDPEQTPLFRSVIQRGGRPCGVMFHVEGPRLLKTSAVWSGDEHRILFYDSTGTRFGEVRLSESPPLEDEGMRG